jgi:ribosome-associated protein
MSISINIANSIKKILEDGKADEINLIDMKDKSDICDYMLIASGTSNRHVISLAEKIIQYLKHEENLPYSSEGMDDGKWVLVDTPNIITHIFHPETRSFYKLEELWNNPKKRSK